MDTPCTYTAFADGKLVASGGLETVLRKAKRRVDRGEAAPILIFEDQTGRPIDFDFQGTPDDVVAGVANHPLFAESPPRTGPGRPKLGVVCREVSLLPRHWDWLANQPGGASATLRRLVDETRKHGKGAEMARDALAAASKVMWALAGDLPAFEEASRALFAKDWKGTTAAMERWPKDIRQYVERLVDAAATLEDDATARTTTT
jgi:uncharacterized protein